MEDKQALISQLKDIQGFQAIIIPSWIVYSLALVAITLLTWWLLKTLYKAKEQELSELEKLEQALLALDFRLEAKDFYLSYSEQIKVYLSTRLEIEALDKTNTELKPMLMSSEYFSTVQVRTLFDCFERADLAKFARREVSLEERQADIDQALTMLSDIDAKYIAILEEQEAKEEKD